MFVVLSRVVVVVVTVLVVFVANGFAADAPQASCQAGGLPAIGGNIPPTTVKGPEQAIATIIVFSDFECFQCGRSAEALDRILQSSHGVKVIFKSAPAESNRNSFLAHEAAIAAGAQGKFWGMHDLLFANQQKLRREDLIGYAKQLGLDIRVFEQALEDHRFRAVVEQDLAEAKGLGVTATPTFFVNGRRLVGPQGEAALQSVVDSVLAASPRQEMIAASGPAQTINLKNAPAQGPADAPISLVEFSDFECPYCAQSSRVMSAVLKAYPTQVRFAFKNYPLPFHREFHLAHEAALAAAEQGKFWEMHELLFATQDKLSREDLIEKARLLNLDIPRFTAALDDHRFRASVDADRQEGERLGVDGTPFFFINGHAISGAADFSDFKRLIDAALSESLTH